MHTRARTLRMLGCLAAAMTGTSALLGWMDPASTAAYERPLADILADARVAVSSQSPPGAGAWQSIQVLAGPVASATLLAAAQNNAHSHFQIGLDGRISPTNAWFRQVDARDGRGAIRVEIVRPDRDGPMSRAQWDCVRALVTALRELPDYHQADLLVRLDSHWTDVYGLAADSPIHVGPIAVGHY